MRILYFTQFYSPENIAAAFRAKEHAAVWTAEGHEVTVFTGWPNYPVGKLFNGYVMERLGKEIIDGVRVFRSQSKMQPNTSFAKRIESGVSFISNGLWNTRKDSPVGEDYDVVLVTSGTVFAAWLGVHFAKKRGLPLVVEFRDLTYRQMIATGSSEASLKVRAMKALEFSFCRAAKKIVVLTNGFKDELSENGVPERMITVVPNGADLVPCTHTWSSTLRLGYFGTMGISQDVIRTLELAAGLHREGLLESYTLIGEGAMRSSVEERLASEVYSFATLGHGIPKDELEPWYGRVHMTVVSLQRNKDFTGTVPSKIFQSFARGTPVLFIGPDGEAARLVRESGGGIALCGDDQECADTLAKFASSPDLPSKLLEMEGRAVDYMRRNYTRRILAERMLDVLSEVTDDLSADNSDASF